MTSQPQVEPCAPASGARDTLRFAMQDTSLGQATSSDGLTLSGGVGIWAQRLKRV